MLDNLVILNLQYFKRDSYISVICQASDTAVEDRKADAVAHLANMLGVKIQGPAFSGTYERKSWQSLQTADFLCTLKLLCRVHFVVFL